MRPVRRWENETLACTLSTANRSAVPFSSRSATFSTVRPIVGQIVSRAGPAIRICSSFFSAASRVSEAISDPAGMPKTATSTNATSRAHIAPAAIFIHLMARPLANSRMLSLGGRPCTIAKGGFSMAWINAPLKTW